MMVRLVVRCLAGAALILSSQFAVAEPGPARQNPGHEPIGQDRENPGHEPIGQDRVTEVEDLLKRDRECGFHDPDRGGSRSFKASEDCEGHHRGDGGRHRDGCGCQVSPH
jgi:hypothetical protein